MVVERQTRGYAIVRLPDVLWREYEGKPLAPPNAVPFQTRQAARWSAGSAFPARRAGTRTRPAPGLESRRCGTGWSFERVLSPGRLAGRFMVNRSLIPER